MKEIFKVIGLDRYEKGKKGEKKITFKCVCESEDEERKLVIFSEIPFNWNYEDKLVVEHKKVQTKVGE
jgi:hypothetical protein